MWYIIILILLISLWRFEFLPHLKHFPELPAGQLEAAASSLGTQPQQTPYVSGDGNQAGPWKQAKLHGFEV